EENTRFWTVFGILSIANGVLINAIVAQNAEPLLKKCVGAVGLLLCVSWTGIQARFAFFCRHWQEKISYLEKEVDESRKLITQTSPPWYTLPTKRGGYLNILFMVAWIGFIAREFLLG
ncbi:MAG: hypothetical protein JSU63_04815, partial [Phycisphaerales bacterium]